MASTNNQNLIRVWDLPLRIFHWLLVAGFVSAYLTEDDFLNIHVWAGYLILGLLLFRLVWGFTGNHHSRFSSFLCTPAQSFAYLKNLTTLRNKRYIGHNPAGAAMIVLLLIALLMTCLTGLAVYGADQGAGPLAFIGADNEDMWEEAHEFFANFSLLLVFVHVCGVMFESYIHSENLGKAMWTGYKKTTGNIFPPK
jgi:cytochrome b